MPAVTNRHGGVAGVVRTFLSLVAVSGASFADGAFPNAMQVLIPASDARRIYVGATFGLVFTADAGASWRYVCEPHVTGGSNVSLYALQSDGAILALADNLTRSTDQGCTWSAIAAPSGTAWVDTFADASDASRVLGVAWTGAGTSSGIWISHDSGLTFPTQLLQSNEQLVSVESAASTPDTIYAATAGSAFFKTDDGGATWQRSDVPGSPATVRILAVSPADPSTVWVRAITLPTTSLRGPAGAGATFLIIPPASGTDHLLRSTDGGATFSELLAVSGAFTGFAHGLDGTLYLSDGNAGLLTEPPGASAFQRRPGPHLQCISLSGSRLLGCSDGSLDPFNVAASNDGGATWSALLNFKQIAGPATCTQVRTACATDWTYQQTVLGIPPAPPEGQGCSSIDPDALAFAVAVLIARRSKARWTRKQRTIPPPCP